MEILSDPLVSFEPSARTHLRGWAIAAAIVARLQEVGFSGGIDVPEVLGPIISDLNGAELQELARQLSGPLADVMPFSRSQLARWWQPARQVPPEAKTYGDFETTTKPILQCVPLE
ncbi:hypothetical protein [Reyranella soli]|uniref:Uncharacterized protein n=1 Tax=Reyranella soli TaxID=1230389 RepID=A0A512NS56_9HYPH|nr:hypothetical protein [Reyranella soli]GEP61752.1 hypothetical protein RSO01_89180 [Reyranella soli]